MAAMKASLDMNVKSYFGDNGKESFTDWRVAQPAHLADLSTLGRRIAWARDQLGLSQLQIADHFGITSQAVSQWEADKTAPGQARLASLARLLQLRLDWLMEGSGEPHDDTEQEERFDGTFIPAPKMLPVIDRVTAGKWTVVADPYPEGGGMDYIATELEWLSPEAFALEIEGTSMLPDFLPGDRVIIDPAISPRPGDFVVAKSDSDDEATFKKYRPKGSDKGGRPIIELVALNADWPSLVIDADNPGRIVGTLAEHRRYRRR